MWQMEARVTSKLRDYDPGTHNAVIDDGSILRGRIEKDAQLAWLASGSFFEVVCARSGHRIAAHYFGGHDGDLTITAVQYLAWSKGRGFVVGLESKNNFGSSWGLLCLYHLGKSRVIRAVELPAQVKALEIVSNIGGANCNTHHLHQHLRWLFGVVALVTHRGWIYLLDLCLDIPLDQSDEANRAGIHLVRASATNLPMLRQRAMAESLHICVELQAGAIQSIAGSALHYAPRTNQLAVGFENGVFQLWDMSSLQQVFQSNLPKATVCAFALQEPENDPRNCCYLWTVQTLPGINKEIILHMFQMEFKERTSSSSANIFYKGLNVCKQRYTQILSAEVSAEQGKHAVCSLLGCHVVERYRHGFSDASLREESSPNTSVVIFVWETAKNHTSQPTITLGLFDINRWYRAQMPTHLSRKELNSYFAVWSLNSLLAEAPSQYVLDTIVHEHSLTHGTPTIYPPPEAFFCPSSFSFDITCLLDGGVIHLTCPGLQHEVLNSLSCAAPLSADSLCVAYDRCTTAGLLSPHFADISPSNLSWEEKMEAVLMAVLRSGHLTMFTKTVRAWAAAGNLDSVNKLCFLLQWTWNKVVLTKEEIDNLCMPLFDGSSRVADPLALSLLGRADARLQNLKSILNLFLKEAPALIDIEDVGCKTNVIVLLSHYILMVMWFCHAHLLPEIPEEYGGWDAEPIVYRWSDLHKYYTSRRQQLSEGARLRWQADCLLIDHMVACGGEKLAKLWQRDEGGTGKYPPRTLHALLDICLLEEVAMDEKNAIVTYFLLDIVYNGEQQHTFVLEDFTVAVGLPAGPRQRTHAFWLFDHKEFQNALETFQPGYPGWEEPWQHICILQALVCQSETALAMRYVFDFAPKPICDDDIKLHLSVLLANRKVVAAWRILNHRGSFAVSRELFWHFFQTCISENLMHHVITFPLTSMQQKYLVEFLRDNNQPKSQELLWLYHMQEANYLAAFRLHQNMRYGLAAGCGPAAHERYMLRNCIMEQYAHVLPCVQRKLTLDRLRPYPKSKHVTCDVVPRPLSTVRPAKGKIMLRSTFLSHLLSKMQEVHSGLSQGASSIIEEKNENIMCSKTLGDFLDTPLRQSCILNQKLTNEVTASPSVNASPATAITLFSSFRNRLNSLQHSLQDLHSSLPQQDISQQHSITVELLQTPPVVRQHPLVNRTTKDEVFPSSNLHIQLFAKMATPERQQDPQRHSEVWFGKLRQEPKLFPDTQTVPQTSQEQHPLVNTATKDEVFPSSNLRTQPFTKTATSERPQDPQCRSEGWIGKLWQERDLFPNTRTVPQMSQEEKPADEEEPSTSGFTRKPVRSAVEMPLYHHSGSSPSKVDMTFINHPEGFHTQTSLGHRPQSFHLSTVKETMESSLCGRQTTAGFSFLEDLAPVKSPKSPSSRTEGAPQHDTWDSVAEGFIKPRKPLHPDSADSMVFEAKPTPEETMQLQLADDESTDNSSTEDADNASECDDEGISTGMEEEAVLPEEAVVSSGSLCAADVMTGSKLFAPEQKVQHLSSSTSKIEDAVHDLQYTTSEEEEEKEDDDDEDYDTPIDDKNEEFHLHLPLTEEEEDEEIENLKPEDTSNLSALQVDQSSVDASPSDAALPSDTASTSDTALPSDTASLSLTEVSVKSIRDSTVAPSPASVIGKDCTMETLQQKTPKRQQGVTGQTPLSRRRSMRLLSISHCDAEGQLKSLSTSKSNEVINLTTPRRSHRFRKNLFSKSTPAGMKEDSNDVLRENRQDSRRSSFRPATDTPKSNSKLLLSLPLMTPSPAVHSISTQTSKSRHTPFEEQGLAGQAATPAKREKVTFVFSPPVTRSCARQRAAAQAATEPLLEYTFSPPHLNPANRTKDGVEEVQRSTGRKQKVKASAEKSVKKNRNKALMIDEELNLISPLASPAMWPRRGKQPRTSMNNRMTLRNRTLWPRPVTRRKLGPTKKAPEGSGS